MKRPVGVAFGIPVYISEISLIGDVIDGYCISPSIITLTPTLTFISFDSLPLPPSRTSNALLLTSFRKHSLTNTGGPGIRPSLHPTHVALLH